MNPKKEYKLIQNPLHRQLIREQMKGFKIMNEFVRQEQRQNLPNLTPEKSSEIYKGLWLMWEYSRKKYPDYKKLDKLRIKELIERRQIWDRIAKGLKSGYDSSLRSRQRDS